MKVPLSWLTDYVPVSLTPRALAERLTMSGSLVEQVHNTGSQWEAIQIARVARLERHPNADTLWLATLDLGDRQALAVTAASNLVAGALVPFIPVGKRLPGQEKPLAPKALRGITGEGMVCSGRELGINEDDDGILILDDLLRDRIGERDPAGASLADYLGEVVLDLEITPNRPDCLSIYGIAREVAAVTQTTLAPMPSGLAEAEPRAATLAFVRVEAPDLCPRCTARVIEGVTIGPSPAWMVERLRAAGIRAINNVVDATNYVMLELGQPLHAYDLDTLTGHGIVVRRAHEGERITTLDGVRRALTTEMLVIADERGPVGVAGVMGGGETEVTAATTRILLEAATFNARSVRRTGVALGLRSEASGRFEKGLPPQLAPIASARAAALIAELGGGTVRGGLLDAGDHETPPRQIAFALGEVTRLLGVQWPTERIVGNLDALGLLCRAVDEGHVVVTVPWWRQDVEQSADLVEEVARIAGFDAIPETLLRGSVAYRPTSMHQRWYAPARRALLACGLSEGSSPSLTAGGLLDLLRPESAGADWLAHAVPHAAAVRAAGAECCPVRVVNPLTPEREYLRVMLLPPLLEALRDNLRNGEDRVAFFELDFCAFLRPGDLPLERRTLAIAMAGDQQPRSWALPPAPIDFYDLKGALEQLLGGLGSARARIVAGAHPLLHPGRAALLLLEEAAIGFLGELHPAIAERWDLGERRAYVAEIDFEALAAASSEVRAFADYPRVPVARRDLAVVVDDATPAADVLQLIRDAGRELVSRVVLFDVYRGEQLPSGRKSLACAVELQAADRTLTDEQVERAMKRIRNTLSHRAGASFRD